LTHPKTAAAVAVAVYQANLVGKVLTAAQVELPQARPQAQPTVVVAVVSRTPTFI
jgi:hypothetical protein